MARLPNPIIDKIEIMDSENYNQKKFYKMIGQAIRKAEMAEKKKGGEGKDETD